MDTVFKALADPSRRKVLDRLYRQDGQTLASLCRLVDFSRQGLSQHIAVLEQAGLVITEFHGREKRHYLNPMPIHEVSERWIAKYSRQQLDALTELKQQLEGDEMTADVFAYETWIRAPRKKVWQALTEAKFTSKYFFATHVQSSWKVGSLVRYYYEPGKELAAEGRVIACDPHDTLSFTWRFMYDEDLKQEQPSRVTFTLSESDGMTRLRIVHDEFPDGSKTFQEITRGWPWIVCGLKSLLETGESLPPMQAA